MQCPKCGYEFRRFAILRAQKISCPDCKARLEPIGMRSPLLTFFLTMLPVQLASLFRSWGVRPGLAIMVLLACGYLAAWVGVIILWIREARRPRLRERARPQPEIVLNLSGSR